MSLVKAGPAVIVLLLATAPPLPAQVPSAASDLIQWKFVIPYGTGNSLYGVHCLEDGTCYAVGSMGTVHKSADYGLTWTDVGPANVRVTLHDVECLRSDACLVVGDGGTILRTSDGGESWIRLESGTAFALRGVACEPPMPQLGREFAGSNGCYAVGDEQTILATANGEKWWHESGPPTLTSGKLRAQPARAVPNLRDVDCSSLACFAVGTDGAVLIRNSEPTLRPGQPAAWSAVAHAKSRWTMGSGRYGSINAVHCKSKDLCFLSSGHTLALESNQWMTRSIERNVLVGNRFEFVGSSQNGTGISCLDSTAEPRSPSEWSAVEADKEYLYCAIAGDHGEIEVTTPGPPVSDDGLLWTVLRRAAAFEVQGTADGVASNTLPWYDASCAEASREAGRPPTFSCVYVGSHGIIGFNTSRTAWRTTESLRLLGNLRIIKPGRMSCAEATTCVTLHENGTIKTENGGETWRVFSIIPNTNFLPELTHISCGDANHCVAVVSSMQLGETTITTEIYSFAIDASESRSEQIHLQSPTSISQITRINCSTASHCLLLEPRARAVHLLHRGPGWGVSGWDLLAWNHTRVELPDTEPYSQPRDISCASDDVCFVLGMSGFIWKTTDGGESWSAMRFSEDTTISVARMSCPSEERCFATGLGDEVTRIQYLPLVSGGQTLEATVLDAGMDVPIRDFACIDTYTCVAVGHRTERRPLADGSFAEAYYGIIGHTRDGGESWTFDAVSDTQLRHVTCADGTCYASGGHAILKADFPPVTRRAVPPRR